MSKRMVFWLVLIFALPTSRTGLAQVSLGFYAGLGSSRDNDDAYALTKPWPQVSAGTSQSGGVTYCANLLPTTIMANITWEATPIFGAALIYRNTKFSDGSSHRSVNSTSLGVLLKLNFVANTRKVVPFIQASYMFSNSQKIHQDKATSPTIPTQTQPGFDITASSSLGISAELGAEVKLGQALAVVLLAGFHGVELSDSNADATIKSLNYGSSFLAPGNIDGAFWAQASLGLKYYFGKGKKKRDF